MKRYNNTFDSKLVPVPAFASSFRESVTDVSGKYRLISKDGTVEVVGTNDKRILIQLNRLTSGFKNIRSF